MEEVYSSLSRRMGQTSIRLATILASLAIILSSLYLSSGITAQAPDCTQTVHSLFTNSEDESTIEFFSGHYTNTSLKMLLPRNADVISAEAHLEGDPKVFANDSAIFDICLVNDVSNSMDDNCYCADGTPSTNGFCNASQGYPYSESYPCKIEDMKDASGIFAEDVLIVPDNALGLVTYDTNWDSSLPLTDDLPTIQAEIDTYSAGGKTCISCGIHKAVEVVTNGSNTDRVIVLMSDGKANYCLGGVACCGTAETCEAAKQDALDEAQAAWDNNSISIITVGFGADADEVLLETIANISKDGGGIGEYFFANESNIEELYEHIAGIITSSYPTNAYLNVGSDGGNEWYWPGAFGTEDDAADYSAALESILPACTCTGCLISGSDCEVDFELGSDTAGFITLNTTVVTEVCIECETDSDCDYLDDKCIEGACDPQTNTCYPEPKPLSTPCEADGDPCTLDHCNGEGLCEYYEYSQECIFDLGDAPDSSNTHGPMMTAYPYGGPPGIIANYPTVHVVGSPPYGPCHNNFFARLGTEISGEAEADTGFDQDGSNNIWPPTDAPDVDSVSLPFTMDDSLKHVPINTVNNALNLPHCQQTSIPVEVTISGGPFTSDWNAYLNIWIDYNGDGDWGTPGTADTVTCPPAPASEWVVQNYVVAMMNAGGFGPGTFTVNPTFTGYNPSPPQDAWMRVQLTEVPVTYEDGSGPPTCYEDGETEDFFVTIRECETDDDCDYLDDDCNDGVCNNDNVCVADPKPLSTPCEADGDFCTVDHCDGTGSCVYYHDYDCDDGVDCTQDSCNETTDQCDNIPDDGYCDDGLYCNGVEYCDPSLDCQPGTPVSCSQYDLPEIDTCDNDPDLNPFTWDYAPASPAYCDEDSDSCVQDGQSLTHQCRDDDVNDGANVIACGAECDQHSDCTCPADGCVGDDYYDYPDQGTCQPDCTCTGCDPVISYQDERCITVCVRNGHFGWGNQTICHGDGTYDECREDGTGYDYVNLCMEECSAAPQCDGFPPHYHFQACDWYGETYLQDYCDEQCQIRDNNCEDTWDGCTSDPECDEVVPGTDSCTYQCEYKPEICYIDDIWGDKPHQYVCLEDNTYLECIEGPNPGYGTHYEHVNVCSYYCSGSIECDGLPPMTYLESCDVFGEDYLQDYCDETCMLADNDCESDYPGCTSHPDCDEAVPGLIIWDQCFECVYQFCGDGFINPEDPFNEECDPEAHNSGQCPHGQSSECDWERHKLGLRDTYGDCTGCLCVDDAFEYDCVEGQCGAACDGDEDCGNFCTGDTLSYNGRCDLHDECACSYDTEDCNDYDDDHFADFHCDVSSGDIWNWYQDWVCEENGPADCAYSGFDWMFSLKEDCFDDCSDTDGGQNFNQEGTVTDRELCDDGSQTACPEYQYTDYCEANILYEYYCDGDDMALASLDCCSLNYHDEYVYYCDGDDVRRHRQFHNHSCTPGGCVKNVSWVDDELVEECLYDGWYNYGNEPGLDDPECEYRDYTCVENGIAACGYAVTESHDYDSQDGSYCMNLDEAVEDRDYYCDASGAAQYAATNQHDCGPEAWSGGGNVAGYGDDPACTYTDYFCVDSGVADYCDSGQPYSEDFDSMDVTECDGPMLLGDHDYWCDLGTCDTLIPSSGCSPGDTWYDLRCDQACGAECDEDIDCGPNTCSVTYNDYCEGMKLYEYDSDRILDSTTVGDECGNTCDTSTTSCSCSDCSPDCSPPGISSYCVLGVCGAECDDAGDCPPWLDFEEEICHYDIPCEPDCGCGPGSEEFCPPAGTVHEGLCYYGVRDCVDVEGCTLSTCTLALGQHCDPTDGCVDIACIDITPITLFHDGTGEKVIEYPSHGSSDSSAKARVPKALVVYSATVNLSGAPVSFSEDRILDFALVNDVSGSMDDNCYCADGTPSINGWCSETQGEPYHPGYPCKIDDMKNASNVFADTVLNVSGNMLGLVSYSSKLKSFLKLTDDLSSVEDEIDSYEAAGHTCISCGIRKGIEIVNEGTNEPVIILMTDGLANRCFAGVDCCGGDPECPPAKAQALSEAQRAWDDYNISIITVGFGTDADEELLQEIADISGDEGGLGSYYNASETDLEDIYYEIAVVLTQIAPTGPSLDAGSDGDTEWSYLGEFLTSQTADFSAELQSLLGCTCAGCTPDGDDCIIDLELASTTAGILAANNLEITGCIPDVPVDYACGACHHCGGGLDCQQEGAWSGWDCAYDGVCDEEADCSRTRALTTYTCVSPGAESSYCDYSTAPEYDYDTQSRETDGIPCDDGLFCTDPDTCTDGVCSGPARDCGDGFCDEDADECVSVPAEEEGPQPVFLDPTDGEIVWGDVVLWAGEMNGRRDIVSAAFDYSQDGESWTPIATDLDGEETPAVCGFDYDDSESDPFTFGRSPPVEGWNATWDTSGLLNGDYLVRVNLTDEGDEIGTEIIELELTSPSPIPVIVRPSYEEVVNGTVNISISTLDDDLIRLNFTLYPVPDYYEKGVTNKSQQNFGLGQGPNGTNIGGMYCGPTSAASCFDYWAENGFPGIKRFPNGTAMSQTDLVEALADLMNTTENGTFKSDFYRAIRQWTKTHGDQFNVSEFRAPNFTVYQRELADKEEDVLVFMLWWSWNGSAWVQDGGHWVVGNSVNQTRNPAPRNDTHWVDLMDPWTGTVVKKRMRDDGWIEWIDGRLWGEVWNIVSVSPKEDARPVIPLGTDLSGANGWWIDWDTTLLDNGYYFLEVEAMDSTGYRGEATTLVRVNNVEPPSCEPTDHVVFSEVMYDAPTPEHEKEWIELYNPTESAVDLTGWRIYDNEGPGVFYDFPEGTIIQPGDYISIARDQDGFHSMYECYADINTYHRGLSNTGDFLSLKDNTMAEIDFVAWEGWDGWDLFASEGKTIQRDPPYCDTDSPDDWLNNTEPTVSCSGETPPEPPGNVSIGHGSIILTWTLSPSLDVKQYNLYFTDDWGVYDFGAPDVVLGNTAMYYVVEEPFASMPLFGVIIRAEDYNGLLSEPSEELGRIDFDLVKQDGGHGKNAIVIPLISDILTASELMDDIGMAPSGPCDAVNYWDSVEQEWYGWISFLGGFGTDFPIEVGDEYEISVIENTTWTLLGEVPQIT